MEEKEERRGAKEGECGGSAFYRGINKLKGGLSEYHHKMDMSIHGPHR